MSITQSIGELADTDITNLGINRSWFTVGYFVLMHPEIQEL